MNRDDYEDPASFHSVGPALTTHRKHGAQHSASCDGTLLRVPRNPNTVLRMS